MTSEKAKKLNLGFLDEDEDVKGMLKMEQVLLERAKLNIPLEPLIVQKDGTPIIIKGTINAIIGSEGSHKSHLAESLASLMISKKADSESGIGFERYDDLPYQVIYFDTERNTTSEYPEAIGNIQKRAEGDNGSEFHPHSLKKLPRLNRLSSLKKCLQYMRNKNNNHMVVFLDVITDCVTNFNEVQETLDLFDHLGKMSEESNATFIVVIHKNPMGEKARGHVGSELANKASTTIYISKKARVVTLDFKKTRYSNSLNKILLQYDEQSCGLVKLSKEEESRHNIKKKNLEESLNLALHDIMEYDKPLPQQVLLNQLRGMLGLSDNTIKKLLLESDLYTDGVELEGILSKLEILAISGKTTTYKLVRM